MSAISSCGPRPVLRGAGIAELVAIPALRSSTADRIAPEAVIISRMPRKTVLPYKTGAYAGIRKPSKSFIPDSGNFLHLFPETNSDLGNHTASNGNRSAPTRIGSRLGTGTGAALFSLERQASASIALARISDGSCWTRLLYDFRLSLWRSLREPRVICPAGHQLDLNPPAAHGTLHGPYVHCDCVFAVGQAIRSAY